MTYIHAGLLVVPGELLRRSAQVILVPGSLSLLKVRRVPRGTVKPECSPAQLVSIPTP